ATTSDASPISRTAGAGRKTSYGDDAGLAAAESSTTTSSTPLNREPSLRLQGGILSFVNSVE
ncbi:hypothetical protein A2U01_0095329, partial [Trifolium medium]|nr:hypothetical protein [Trifolium medium]